MNNRFKSAWKDFRSSIVSMEKWRKWQLILSILGLPIVSYLLWASITNQTAPLMLLSQLVLAVGYLIAVIFHIRNKWDWALWFFITLAVLVISATMSRAYWDDLHRDQDSVSTTIRNLGLLIGGVIAILLAVWRSKVAESQSETAQKSLLNERYQKGAEMLGSEVLAVRLGGIYALQRLAEDNLEQYHVQIMRLFCAFARNPTAVKNMPDDPNADAREDVQAVMQAIRFRRKDGIRLERNHGFRLGLSSAHLKGVRLMEADLSRAVFTGADLSGTRLDDSDLSCAWLDKANLTSARLGGAILSGADLWATNLTGAFFVLAKDDEKDRDLKVARGLTQEQLNSASPDAPRPPSLQGVLDAKTGEQLVWHDRSLQDDADGDC